MSGVLPEEEWVWVEGVYMETQRQEREVCLDLRNWSGWQLCKWDDTET